MKDVSASSTKPSPTEDYQKRFNLNLKRSAGIVKPLSTTLPKIVPTLVKVSQGVVLGLLGLTLAACEKTPPDYRPEVTLPEYTQGDADRGKVLYKEVCSQCHQLTPGLNKKGPQLMNIYGAPAALLKDYKYSQGLQSSGWVWDAKTLDPYIADPQAAISDSKMLADPLPDAKERADIIAYLSTLRAPVPAPVEEGS